MGFIGLYQSVRLAEGLGQSSYSDYMRRPGGRRLAG